MFEDLKLQRMQGASQKEKRRLLVTVSLTLVLGAVTWPYWGCQAAPAPEVQTPIEPKEAVGKPLDLAPLQKLKDAGGSMPGLDLAALDYVLSEVRRGELKRQADSVTTVAAVDALNPKTAVGASVELRGTVRSLERESYDSPSKMAVNRLWTFALEDAEGKRVLVHHAGSSSDPDEGKPADAYKAAPTRLSDGDVVRVRAFYLQQRTSGTAGSIAIDRPTAVLVGREYRRSIGKPVPAIESLADADWAGVADRFLGESRGIEDRAHFQTLAWAKSLGHDEILKRIKSKAIPVKEFDRDAFLGWMDEVSKDERQAEDAPDTRTWTNAAKGQVFATVGMYLGEQTVLEDWDYLPPNAFDVNERYTVWFLSDHYLYAGMRTSSAFPPDAFAGIDPGARQQVLVYGVFLKNYTYALPHTNPKTHKPVEVTVPFFVVLHMEPHNAFKRLPLYQNAFWWVTISLAFFGILFYVVLIRGERREAIAAESHRIDIRKRARAKPGQEGGAPPAPPKPPTEGGDGGAAPAGGPGP